MEELEFKEYIYKKANDIKTKEDLDNLLNEILNSKEIDYGKIVYAMSGAMLGVAKFIDRSEIGGITGFQAGFVGWEMVKDFLIHDNKTSMRIINYDEMLYPQYKEKFKKTISKRTWECLQEQAKIYLKEIEEKKGHEHAHPKIIKHWKKIAKGKLPFGYKVEKER